MPPSKLIQVEVVYAERDQQFQIEVKVPEKSTVADAIIAAKIDQVIPTLDWRHAALGIFSQKVTLDHEVAEGDRIEIYRPLTMDPKLARRLRASDKISRKNGDGY